MARSEDGLRQPTSRRRDGWWLLVIVYSALLVRGYVPYPNVLGGAEVNFQGNDAWYHLRLIDHLLHNFPRPLIFDPYAFFPGGQEVVVAPLFDFAVALVAWLLGLGSPSQRLTDLVAAWFPAVLGALTPLPVYFLGRRLFDRRVGLLAAGLLAVQPGQFLLRSLLGFTDHHVAETLLSTVTVWLVVAAVATPRGAGTTEPPAQGAAGGPASRGSLRAGILAGLALGAYLLTWGGGSLLVAVLILWVACQHLLDHLLDRPSGYLARVTLSASLAALAALAPFLGVLPRAGLHIAALAALAATPLVLAGLQGAGRRVGLPRPLYPAAVTALAILGWVTVQFLWPSLAGEILENLARFRPSPLSRTVGEAQPLLSEGGSSPWALVWVQYRAAFVLGLVGLAILARRMIRERAAPGQTLLMVWSLAMLAATLAQNRFGYYLDVNLSLLVGLLCWTILVPAGLAPGHGRPSRKPLLRVLAAAAVVVIAFLPTLEPVLEVARQQRGPTAAWRDALRWLRHHTPEPFGHPGAYLARFEPPPPGATYPYPATAYGVMAWWDYGYWITRLGRRIPNANPTQRGAGTAARFYTATDETAAARILDEAGSRYVVANFELGFWPDPEAGTAYGLFGNLVPWAERNVEEFFELYWEPGPDGRMVPTVFFYPAFYESMAIRLILTGGEPVFTTDATWVIAFREVRNRQGETQKEVVAAHLFHTYEEARAFLSSRPDPHRWRLAGRDPRYPCLPLGPLRTLRQVYPASGPAMTGPTGELPLIRIFERVSP